MLNTIHLRTFLAVVDAGSYTAAAERLHLSQPAVSQHIQALEEQLGEVRLFRRLGQRMVPTHVGEELLNYARELASLSDRAEQSILALKGQVAGRVVVGCTPSSGERLLPTLIQAFHGQFPSVALEVVVASGQGLLDSLAAQQISVLLIEEQVRRRGWETQLLGREGLTLVAPNNHPLLQQEEVPPGSLRDHELILPRIGGPLRRAIDEGLRRRGVAISELKVVLETDSAAFTVQAVREGLGLAFVPASRLSRADKLGSVELAGAPMYQDWYLLRSRDRSTPRAAQELYTFLTGSAARTALAKLGIKAIES
ncbi:MAG: LysR family transcriptional regulator [Chloroflexaceae bacterium]|jgi:DNA-binding transcriptional LysR family regulator|nr:LysR family transcriptional regulator [Chloroflexaceae bacterium]